MIKTKYLIPIILFGIVSILGCSQDDSPIEWKQVLSGTDAHFYGIHFVDTKHGWAAGSGGTVLSSKNGGITWRKSTDEGLSNTILTQVVFTTPKNGWLASIGKVHYTGSSGKSWRVQHQERAVVGKSPGILDIYFVNKTEGWAVGGTGTILHTQNGGGKWKKVRTSSEEHLWGVHFVDPQHGWIVGENGEVLRTQNGGKQWNIQKSEAEQPLFAVHFANLRTGWIVGANGLILRTDDGGKTWDRHNKPFKQSLRDVAFSNEKMGWAVGEEGLILRTTDGGITWERYASPTSNNLQDIHLLKNSGWIAGEKGTILKMN